MMSAIRLPYRLRQVSAYAGSAQGDAPELPPDAQQRLSEPMVHQFRILSTADQKHLIRVYTWLLKHGADDDTITAGLIHDVGKACAKCKITILDRSLHVFLSRFAGPLYRRFARIETAPEFARGLHRLANHTERGALAATQAGYDDRVVDLIRYHEFGGDKNDVQLQLLRRADEMAERS